MHFSNPLSSSPTSSIFPAYLIPNIPFRRRTSSVESSDLATSPSSITEAESPSFLAGSTSHLHCSYCLADLCPTSAIISKGFTGRHGRAYLVAPPSRRTSLPWVRHERERGNLPNTTLDKAVPRQLVTGAHTVADLRCGLCDSVLGWKYVAAEEEGQRYKVGKFILETKRVTRRACWEDEGCDDLVEAVEERGGVVSRGSRKGKHMEAGAITEIEFDSQDEDECEDLFAGVWSPALARKRRERRQVWKKDADVDMV